MRGKIEEMSAGIEKSRLPSVRVKFPVVPANGRAMTRPTACSEASLPRTEGRSVRPRHAPETESSVSDLLSGEKTAWSTAASGGFQTS